MPFPRDHRVAVRAAPADAGIIPFMDKLRVAVVGVGYLGRFHAQKYASLPDCTLIAVVDTLQEAGAALAAELGTRHLRDYREALGRVDAVSVVTPTPSHFEVARAFLESGAHVLVEKPITETVLQAQQLIGAARQARRVLQVGHPERFHPTTVSGGALLRAPRFFGSPRPAPVSSIAPGGNAATAPAITGP